MRGGERKHHQIKAQGSKLPSCTAASSQASTKQPPKSKFPCGGETRHFSRLSLPRLGLGREDRHAGRHWWLCLKQSPTTVLGREDPHGHHCCEKPLAHSVAISTRIFGAGSQLSPACALPAPRSGAEFSVEDFYGHFKSLCFGVLCQGENKTMRITTCSRSETGWSGEWGRIWPSGCNHVLVLTLPSRWVSVDASAYSYCPIS